MKWNLGGEEFITDFSIKRMPIRPVEHIVSALIDKLEAFPIPEVDPVKVYLEMHEQATQAMSSDRGKKHFVASANKRAKRLGPGKLLRVTDKENEYRIIVYKEKILVLRDSRLPRHSSLKIAESIHNTLGGELIRIVF
jgi:hypothetical protein